MGTLAQQEHVVPAERHYAVIEVAEMWNLSPDKVREIFEREPGVLVIGEEDSGNQQDADIRQAIFCKVAEKSRTDKSASAAIDRSRNSTCSATGLRR